MAQFSIDFGDGDLKINVWPACLYDRPGASQASVRAHARAAGYRRIHNIRLHKRKYNNANRCGFYRAEAWRNGRQFALYFNADSADLINVRVIGRGRGPDVLPEAKIRNRLQRQGWRRIRNLRYVENRGGAYVARARNKEGVYRLRINASNGKVERQKQLKQFRASKKEVRNQLRARGYRDIRNLRIRSRRGDEYWVARATRRGTVYRVFADEQTGKPVRRVALEKDRISRREARNVLRRAGFRGIENLRMREVRGEAYFVARAKRWGQTYRVWVDADDGEIARTRRTNN